MLSSPTRTSVSPASLTRGFYPHSYASPHPSFDWVHRARIASDAFDQHSYINSMSGSPADSFVNPSQSPSLTRATIGPVGTSGSRNDHHQAHDVGTSSAHHNSYTATDYREQPTTTWTLSESTPSSSTSSTLTKSLPSQPPRSGTDLNNSGTPTLVLPGTGAPTTPTESIVGDVDASTGIDPATGAGPKRPPNSWICYRTARSKELRADGVMNLPQAAISKLIASQWRGETPEVRAHYARMAEEKKKELLAAHPDYSYQPMRKPKIPGAAPRRGRPTTSSRVDQNTQSTSSGGLAAKGPLLTKRPSQSGDDFSRHAKREYFGPPTTNHMQQPPVMSGVGGSRALALPQHPDMRSMYDPEHRRDGDHGYSPTSPYEYDGSQQQRVWYMPESASAVPEPSTSTNPYFHYDSRSQPIATSQPPVSQAQSSQQHMYSQIHDYRTSTYEPEPLILRPMPYSAGPAYHHPDLTYWPQDRQHHPPHNPDQFGRGR